MTILFCDSLDIFLLSPENWDSKNNSTVICTSHKSLKIFVSFLEIVSSAILVGCKSRLCVTDFEEVDSFGKSESSALFRILQVDRHFVLISLEKGVQFGTNGGV